MTKIVLLKKNPCPDCSFCQCCSETRCNMCKHPGAKAKKTAIKKPHKPLFRAY